MLTRKLKKLKMLFALCLTMIVLTGCGSTPEIRYIDTYGLTCSLVSLSSQDVLTEQTEIEILVVNEMCCMKSNEAGRELEMCQEEKE